MRPLVAVALFTAVASACATEPAALSEWARQVCEIEERLASRFDEIPPIAYTSEWTTAVEQGTRLLPLGLDAVSDYVAELEEVQPPAEAREYHEAAIASGRAFVELSEGTLRGYQAVAGPADLRALRERLGPVGAESKARFEAIERATDPQALDALMSAGPCGSVSKRLAPP